MEQAALPIPERTPAPRPLQRSLEHGRAEFLNLVDKKSQHHQHHEDLAQVLFAEPKVVTEMVSMVFEGVEGLVLDLPTTPATTHQDICVLLGDSEVGHPREFLNLSGLGVALSMLHEIDFQAYVGLIQ